MTKISTTTEKKTPIAVVRVGISFTNNDVLQNLMKEEKRTGIKINTLIKVCVSEKYGNRN